MIMLCIGSAFFILTGALCFYTKDIVWDVLSFLLEKMGFATERTRTWDVLITLYGVIALVIGVFALYRFFRGI